MQGQRDPQHPVSSTQSHADSSGGPHGTASLPESQPAHSPSSPGPAAASRSSAGPAGGQSLPQRGQMEDRGSSALEQAVQADGSLSFAGRQQSAPAGPAHSAALPSRQQAGMSLTFSGALGLQEVRISVLYAAS